jgi:hypothetical protein
LDRMAAYLISQYGGQHGEKTDSSEKSERPDKSEKVPVTTPRA